MKKLIVANLIVCIALIFAIPARALAGGKNVLSEKASEKLIRFDLPKGKASERLEAFGKIVNRPVIYRADRIKGVRLNGLEREMTLSEAIVSLVSGTKLVITEDRATGALVVKVDPKKRSPQSSVDDVQNDKKRNTKKAENMKTGGLKTFRSIVSMVGLGIVGAEADVNAQDDDADGLGIYELDAFMVTATRREKPLREVPISVSAFGGLDIDRNRITKIEDVSRYTPGFTASSFSNTAPIFAIRGANNTFSQAGASKPVGVFVDDVFIPRNSASDFNLFDIEQIAILRGPQGTLFGRNVTGGAIQITTAEPELLDKSFRTKLSAGNLGYLEAAASANVGLSDASALRFSVSMKDRDGYITDRFSGLEYNSIDSINLRGSLLLIPSENVELLFSADYSEDENNGRGYSLVSDSAGIDFSDNDGDIRTGELDVPQAFDRKISGTSLKATLDLDAGELVSITAYRKSESHEYYSLGAGAVALPTVSTQLIKDEQDDPDSFSQELRFVSKEGGVFDYVAGLYYYDEDTDRVLNDVLLGAGGAATFFDRTYDVESLTESYAAYFDATIQLQESLDLNIGGRYTDEEKEVVVNYIDSGNAAQNFDVSPRNGFTEFTSRVALNWAVSDVVNVFASRTEGFTAGGFNTETNSIAAIELGFEPETVVAYEVGAKTLWMDNRLAINGSAFSQAFEDKQEGFFNVEERFFSIFNASEATSRGLEIETSYATSHSLSFHLSYSYLDTEYDEFMIPGGANFTGNQLQTAPEHTFSLSSNYWKTIENLGELNVNVGYFWQDDYFTGASNAPSFLIDSYGLANASIGLKLKGRNSSIKIWANNLLDEEYLLIRGTSGAIGEYYGPPRTYGITLISEF